MTIPLENFIEVKISRENSGIVGRNFSTPLVIGTGITIKDSKKDSIVVTSTKELIDLAEFGGAAITESSAVFQAVSKLKAGGISSIIVSSVSKTSAGANDISSSLGKVKLNNQFFYCLSTDRGFAEIDPASNWCEENEVMFFTSQKATASSDSALPESGEPTDTAGKLAKKGRRNSVILASDDDTSFPDARWISERGAEQPGRAIWAYAPLPGIKSDSLTQGRYNNLISKNTNAYIEALGKKITTPGITTSGDWIDRVIAEFYLKARVQEGMFDLISSKRKIPFTSGGIAVVASQFNSILAELSVDIIDSYSITAPKFSSLSSSDRDSRNIKISATTSLQGAIQSGSFDIRVTLDNTAVQS